MKGIYRFSADFGRMGHLTGVFTADSRQIELILGKRVHFGEALGKHSEVYIDCEKKHFELLTIDQDFISKAEEYRLSGNGYNPFEYIDPEEWDEDEEFVNE